MSRRNRHEAAWTLVILEVQQADWRGHPVVQVTTQRGVRIDNASSH
jgi:hypothetical protein